MGRFRIDVLRAAGLSVALAVFGAQSASSQSLTFSRTIDLPGVTGRIDHLGIDLEGNRLFVAALGAGFVVSGGIGATMRLLMRRGREGKTKARFGPFSLVDRD